MLVFDRPADGDQRSQRRVSASSGVATYTVTHAFIADAASSGNILFVGALDASKAVHQVTSSASMREPDHRVEVMALVLRDRVKETTTTGTGTYTLAGAVTGFEAFSSVGNGNTTYYACSDGTDFEVGLERIRHPVQRWLVPRSYKALTA